MTGGQLPTLQHRSDVLRQIQKPERVRHRRAGLAHRFGNFVLREAVLVDQRLIALRLLERL